MNIFSHYGKEKQRFLDHCTQCGVCAEGCPILPFTEIGMGDVGEGSQRAEMLLAVLSDFEPEALICW
jgi:Fe-S oxidoreductase